MLDLSQFDWHWLLNAADVLIVAWVIYRVLLVIRGTRAATMLWGLAFVVVVYFAARQAGLKTLSWMLGNFLSSIVLVAVIIFQDEIRRGLTKVGLNRGFLKSRRKMRDKTIDEITMAAQKLATERLGALIVVQGSVGLEEIVEEALTIDSVVDRKLMYSIFLKDSPLHDGALLVESDRIKAAGCVLPLSQNPDLDPNLGTRHRAGVGLSERCDALVLVVSEETGAISMAREGKLTRNIDSSMLRDSLHRLLSSENGAENGDRQKAS